MIKHIGSDQTWVSAIYRTAPRNTRPSFTFSAAIKFGREGLLFDFYFGETRIAFALHKPRKKPN